MFDMKVRAQSQEKNHGYTQTKPHNSCVSLFSSCFKGYKVMFCFFFSFYKFQETHCWISSGSDINIVKASKIRKVIHLTQGNVPCPSVSSKVVIVCLCTIYHGPFRAGIMVSRHIETGNPFLQLHLTGTECEKNEIITTTTIFEPFVHAGYML